ncbi:MAG: 3-phosphoserine/phosphohydroxythreonine transaminase [Gammaproteobacteria bacterium]|nr:3-phosphoserine/phosphohydroxythreonine transaminase [Gammaproteobacteria bacterium]
MNPIKKPMTYNFGAGPAMMPAPVMQAAHEEWFDWQHQGMSIVEIGHRTSAYMAMMADAEACLRTLLAIPKSYHVLFLGGAARTQFSMIPMNLLTQHQQGGYVVSGIWSEMACEEARQIKSAYCIANSEAEGFIDVPQPSHDQIQDNTAYIYYTSNETINGVRFPEPPRCGSELPLVVDMTSSLLSEPLTITDYGLIFAGSQKNIAPAGLTVVIVRKDLLAHDPGVPIPTMLDYRVHASHHSLYATPPSFSCYMALKMFQWLQDQGGIDVVHQVNLRKAAALYDYIDGSTFYEAKVVPAARSIMNVCFNVPTVALEEAFVTQATQAGLYALKGHRRVGGLRASLYNAMPMTGVDALLEFMADFAKANQ